MIIVFDLDGTLSDVTHRLHFIEPEVPLSCTCVSIIQPGQKDVNHFDPLCPRHTFKKNWDGFFDACDKDTSILEMVELAQALTIYNDVRVWTGRPERVREKTERWLLGRFGHSIDEVRMRGTDDRREDYEVKQDWLKDCRPDIVFEDRQQVVDMYRRNGIRCAQVAKGDY